jgi:DNA invertase Pin-like site-specific DNA recombinase
MQIGYARTSTTHQEAGLDAQLRDLNAAGCEKIFSEQLSSVDIANRDQLEAALDYVRDGDTLIVTKLDRLARSVRHLMEIVDRIKAKGAALRILNLGIDTGTPTGKLMLTLLGGIAEFEREIMLERQREGIAKAQREKRFLGKRPKAFALEAEISSLAAQNIGPTKIAKQLGIARSSVYRVLGATPEEVADMQAKLPRWKKGSDTP